MVRLCFLCEVTVVDEDAVIVITQEEWDGARQKELDRLGMTWDQLVGCVDECGCCITLPDEFSHLSEEHIRLVWMVYRP